MRVDGRGRRPGTDSGKWTHQEALAAREPNRRAYGALPRARSPPGQPALGRREASGSTRARPPRRTKTPGIWSSAKRDNTRYERREPPSAAAKHAKRSARAVARTTFFGCFQADSPLWLSLLRCVLRNSTWDEQERRGYGPSLEGPTVTAGAHPAWGTWAKTVRHPALLCGT